MITDRVPLLTASQSVPIIIIVQCLPGPTDLVLTCEFETQSVGGPRRTSTASRLCLHIEVLCLHHKSFTPRLHALSIMKHQNIKSDPSHTLKSYMASDFVIQIQGSIYE
jgi:hypothetical protein